MLPGLIISVTLTISAIMSGFFSPENLQRRHFKGAKMVKDVTSKKFNAIMSKKIYLHKCPKCPNLGGEIIIPMTTYGAKTDRVYIRCKYCGYETKCYDAEI